MYQHNESRTLLIADVRERAGEIVSTDLIRWYQRIVDEIVIPLLQDIIVLSQVGIVVCSLGIRQGHYKHISTLFEWLHLIVTIVMTSSVRKRESEIVYAELIRPVSGLLIDEKRIKYVSQYCSICIDGDWMERKGYIDGLDVAVGANFFQEYPWCFR